MEQDTKSSEINNNKYRNKDIKMYPIDGHPIILCPDCKNPVFQVSVLCSLYDGKNNQKRTYRTIRGYYFCRVCWKMFKGLFPKTF